MPDFSSFAEFQLFLLSRATLDETVIHHALERSTRLIEEEAKAELGVYQPRIGEFNAWDELADSTKEDRLAQGFPENEPLLRTGEMRDSISGSVDGMQAVVGSTSDKAVWQELGTVRTDHEGRTDGQGIPPRPFLGPAGLREEKRVVDEVNAAYASIWLGASLLRLGHDD